MASAEMMRSLFEYHQAMNERLWTLILEHLTDAQFTQENGYSHGSIRSQLIHMASTERYWISDLLGTPTPQGLDDMDYPTREAAREICQQADQEFVDSVRGLTDADLQRTPDWWSLPIEAGLEHVSIHNTDHRSQILKALHDLGVPTFEQNFAGYLEDKTPMPVAKLVNQINLFRAEWDGLLAQADPTQVDQPVMEGRSVRDIIAMILFSERSVIDFIQQKTFREVRLSALPADEQERILSEHRALNPDALMDQYRATYAALCTALGSLTDSELNDSTRFKELPIDSRPWQVIARATSWHYPRYLPSMRQFLKSEA